MKVYRADEAAERLGLSQEILELLEQDGRIHHEEKISGVAYYSQAALDQLIQDLHCSMQRASWKDMETRMETVEKHLEDLDKAVKKLDDSSKRVY